MSHSGQKKKTIVDEKTPRPRFLTLRADHAPLLFPLLQRGFMVRAVIGRSIKDVLCLQLGVSPDYLEERVQTIFLDGKTVDDVDASIVAEGSTLALSAAMPGLVGATLRRGGSLAAMRSQITYHSDEATREGGDGFFTLKLFNLVLQELGPTFLEMGIWVQGNSFRDFLDSQQRDFVEGRLSIEMDGREIDRISVLREAWLDESDPVLLKTILKEGGDCTQAV